MHAHHLLFWLHNSYFWLITNFVGLKSLFSIFVFHNFIFNKHLLLFFFGTEAIQQIYILTNCMILEMPCLCSTPLIWLSLCLISWISPCKISHFFFIFPINYFDNIVCNITGLPLQNTQNLRRFVVYKAVFRTHQSDLPKFRFIIITETADTTTIGWLPGVTLANIRASGNECTHLA